MTAEGLPTDAATEAAAKAYRKAVLGGHNSLSTWEDYAEPVKAALAAAVPLLPGTKQIEHLCNAVENLRRQREELRVMYNDAAEELARTEGDLAVAVAEAQRARAEAKRWADDYGGFIATGPCDRGHPDTLCLCENNHACLWCRIEDANANARSMAADVADAARSEP